MCNSFRVCFQIFKTFGYKKSKKSDVVVCHTAQTQFINPSFPGNPVLIAVTLYLDYLLLRYF